MESRLSLLLFFLASLHTIIGEIKRLAKGEPRNYAGRTIMAVLE